MKVDIIIGGFQKCGSTALHHFLSQHPKVIGSSPKEIDYFSYHAEDKGIDFYHSFYQKKIFGKKRGYFYLDGSVSYMTDKDPKITADRIFNYNDLIKIVALIRDPVERAYSAWNMYRERYFSGRKDWWLRWIKKRGELDTSKIIRRQPEEYKNFHLFIENEISVMASGKKIECPVLNLGLYDKGIRIYQEKFRDNLIVLRNEDLARNTGEELKNLASSLNLPEYNWSQFEGKKIFSGKYQDKINENTKQILKVYYSQSDKNLYHLTGYTYN